jgi:hypothetical protein
MTLIPTNCLTRDLDPELLSPDMDYSMRSVGDDKRR